MRTLVWLSLALAGCGSSPQVSPRDSVSANGQVSEPITAAPPGESTEGSAGSEGHGSCVATDGEAAVDCPSAREGGDRAAAEAHAARGERAHDREDLAECASEFSSAFDAHPAHPEAAAWAFTAYECAHRARFGDRRRSDVHDPVSRPRSLTAEDRSLDRLAARVWCGPNPAEQRARALYTRARLRYEARRYGEAVPLPDRVVEVAPGDDVAIYASSLALDALTLHGEQQPSVAAECLDRYHDVVPRHREALCSAPSGLREAHCDTLAVITCQLHEREAEALTDAARWAEASEEYERLAEHPDCTPQHERLLHDAAVLAERSDDPVRARRLSSELERRFPDSTLPSPVDR